METGAAAVNAMLKSRFDADSFPQTTGLPKHGPIDELVCAIAMVATGFKPHRYGRKTGCLALVVGQEEMRQIAKDNTLDFSRAEEPQLLNLKIVDTTTTTGDKILTAEHSFIWYDYYLEQAVDLYGVATISTNTNHQYLAVNNEDYIGYANKMTRSIIKQLETHPAILNEEKLDIRAAFFAPWSDAPDMNLGEYARTLDKRQCAAKTFRVNISDGDKKPT